MARKKRLLDDGDSDSSAHSDDEFDFEDDAYFNRKRQRTAGKEDVIYGVFGDSEDESTAPRTRRSAKAPLFVASDGKVDIEMDLGMEAIEHEDAAADAGSEGNEDGGSDSEDDQTGMNDESSDVSEPSRPPSPRVYEDQDDEPLERPRFGGIGTRATTFAASFSQSEVGTFTPDDAIGSRGGIGSVASRGGIGSAAVRSGIGLFEPSFKEANATASDQEAAAPDPESRDRFGTPDLPSSFGRGTKQSFVRNAELPKPAVKLTAADVVGFQKMSGTFGARMLEKMGWQVGTGLGASGEGIVTPVESKLRPQKMGIAYRGFRERTDQAKREAKRRGEDVSDDEGTKGKKSLERGKGKEQKRSDAWKKPKKVKTKLEHKTYEQILAEADQESVANGLGQIIDATGAVPREVSSIADVSLNSWTPSTDSTRIPEVRYNIRLIAESCKNDLDALAREAKALDHRKKSTAQEDATLRMKAADESDLVERLQKIQLVVNDINTKSKELSQVYETSLEPLSPLFYTLLEQFSGDFERYRLDEVFVAAIAPLIRRMVAGWNPLEEPTAFISTFRLWKRALRTATSENQIATIGAKAASQAPVETAKAMTPFESLLWNVWLPRVRACINNEWSASEPQPAVKLYEAWSTFLPPFIRDNLMDQLILPKVQKAVVNWAPRSSNNSLQALVFPWLPHLGLRMDDIIGDALRKIKGLLKGWQIGDDIPSELPAWKNLFDVVEWDSMILKYVVPKLGATLRDDFRVNPRDQRMEPLQRVLDWKDLIRPSVLSQIFETEFFTKWLDVLHIWLIQPSVSFEEVALWYSFWKQSFPEAVQNLPGINRGFTRGLQLMNEAIALGPDAPMKLLRPDFRAEQAGPGARTKNGTKSTGPARPPASRVQEITFRSIVEEFAAAHNLLFIPTGKAHETSRLPLFRVSPTADGKGGILVYIQDDAVWAPVDGKEYQAIPLEEMVLKATG